MVRRVSRVAQAGRPRRTPQERAALNAQIREVDGLLAKRQAAIDSRAAELAAQVRCGALTNEEASQLFGEWMTERGVALLQRRDHVFKHFIKQS